MRFRLRYQNRELDLTEGEFAVGRHASCHLALEDPLVSRKHAVFRVEKDAVFVSDNGSRNGVLVNSERIDGEVQLRPGDMLLIGSQEMTLVSDSAAKAQNFLKRTLPRVQVAPPIPELGEEEVIIEHMQTSESRARDGKAVAGEDSEVHAIRKLETFNLVGGVAEKALAMGKTQDAERMLASPLADIVESIRSGKRVTASLVDTAARLSAKLAVATGKGAWADYVVELYSHQRRPFPAPVVEELSTALRRVSSFDLSKFRVYLEDLRSRAGAFTPAERFLVQRIEGLERIAALR